MSHLPEYAGDMTATFDPPRKYWQAGPGEGCIGFTESKITKVLARGNRQVPEVCYAVCDRIGVKPKDIDLLVTNQPNRVFLRNWREALEMPKGVTATRLTSAATCSPRASRSTSTARSPTAS